MKRQSLSLEWLQVNRPALTLLILCFFTFFLGLGRQAITDSDEGYYAEASREMVESGDWLTPRFNYENRFEKPILYYWLTASTYAMVGTGEAAARFWSAVSGVGLVLLTWGIAGGGGGTASREAGPATPDRRSSWLAGIIVATCFGCFTMARWALPDLPLTFFITLGIWAALRASCEAGDPAPTSIGWWAIAGLGAGLGFLTKGPVALVIPAVVLVPIWWRERRTIRIDPRGVALAVVIFAVTGLPWYILMWREHGAPYLRGFFVGDNVERFTTSRFNDARPIWYYAPVALGGLLPWSTYLLTFVWRPAIDVLRRRVALSDRQWRLLIWSIAPLIFYTLSIGKQPRYILPVLTPIAVLLAEAIARRIAASGRQAGLTGATWATAALFVVLGLLFVRMQPVFVNTYPVLTWAGATVAFLAAGAFAWVAGSQTWRRLPFVIAVSGAALLIAVQFGALAGRRPEAVEQVAALVLANRTAGEPVLIYRAFTRNLGFYTGLKHILAFDVGQAAASLRAPERTLLVSTADNVREIESKLGTPLRVLGRVQYVNSANLRLGTLLQPDPADEVTEVLVVTNR